MNLRKQKAPSRQVRRVTKLVADKSAKEIIKDVRQMADDALNKAFEALQEGLGVESGDQACYYVDGRMEEMICYMARYAMSEVVLVLDRTGRDDLFDPEWPLHEYAYPSICGSRLVRYELDYMDGHKEEFRVSAGSNAETLVKDYAETNGYNIQPMENDE